MNTFPNDFEPGTKLRHMMFISDKSLQETSLSDVIHEEVVDGIVEKSPLSDPNYELEGCENDLESCASMDLFSKDCLSEFLAGESYTSTTSLDYCIGKDLYNTTDLTGFYDGLKKVPNSDIYRKKCLSVDFKATNRPTRMAELLAAQLSNDPPPNIEHTKQQGFNPLRCLGRCFSRWRKYEEKERELR